MSFYSVPLRAYLFYSVKLPLYGTTHVRPPNADPMLLGSDDYWANAHVSENEDFDAPIGTNAEVQPSPTQ